MGKFYVNSPSKKSEPTRLYSIGGFRTERKSIKVFHSVKKMGIGKVNLNELLSLSPGSYVFEGGYAGIDEESNEPKTGIGLIVIEEILE